MLKGKTIVCVANTPWGGTYQKSTVVLLKQLANHNRILYVEFPPTAKDLVSLILRGQWQSAAIILGIKHRLRPATTKPDCSIQLLTPPPVLPFGFAHHHGRLFDWLLRFNARIVERAINKAQRQLAIQHPIVINAFNPLYGYCLLGRLHERAMIYYCYDEITADRYGLRGKIYEEKFMAQVAGVITSSPALWQEKQTYSRRCYLVKNGVNFPLFSQATAKPRPHHVNKVVCYLGSVDQRFDFDVVRWCVERQPEYRFLIVGRMVNKQAYSALAGYANLEFRPPVAPEKVPEIIRECDAGIIPYTRTNANRFVYPLKINEYLAAGLPVVVTDFADLREFEKIISVAATKEAFLQRLLTEITNDTEQLRDKRKRFAATNAWDLRGKEFDASISDILQYGVKGEV